MSRHRWARFRGIGSALHKGLGPLAWYDSAGGEEPTGEFLLRKRGAGPGQAGASFRPAPLAIPQHNRLNEILARESSSSEAGPPSTQEAEAGG